METTVIIVNGRSLTGPNSSAQVRGGRLFLPVTTIARALGDTIRYDVPSKTVTILRQNGTPADFNAQLNQVRENGSVVLAVSASADIVFPLALEELMLPAEIVAALLDVSIRRDEGRAIAISSGIGPAQTARAGTKHSRWELFQLEYDYNLSRYTSSTDQSLTLRGTGRLGDGRFTFLANSAGGAPDSRLINMRSGSFRLERPNGQTFVAGDFGTGNDLEFMSSAIRGGAADLPSGKVRLNFFLGRSLSGVLDQDFPTPAVLSTPSELRTSQPRSFRLKYDTNIVGAYASTGSDAEATNHRDLQFSVGGMHYDGPTRRGDIVAGSVRYVSGRNRFQADVAGGEFSGVNRDNVRTSGAAEALTVSGSLQLTEQVLAQGRYTYVGRNFLSPQSGVREPINLTAAGITWQPKRWLTAGLSGSTATTPGRVGDFNRFFTTTVNLTPRERWPAIFFSHTQSGSTQLRNSEFTLISATKQFQRWRLFLNGTRVKTFGAAALNAQLGSSIRIRESSSVELSQSIGSRGLFSGMASWQISSLFRKRLSFGGGLGYLRSNLSSLQTSEHLSASLRLPRQSTLQFSYLRTQTGPTLLLTLHGSLLSSRRTERAINGPLAEVNSYGSVYGRVYQDINLNGRFDPGIDQPQANVKVRVDGSRYVVSAADGSYRVDSVMKGDHAVYLDLLSVRADLTMLDGAQQQISLDTKRDSVVDFRLVRTGRVSGVVWLDVNGNGTLDNGEQPLADVRVVTGNGRDTLTDANGCFLIGDLPPGEHVVLLDEKTLPEQTRSAHGSLMVRTLAGNETVVGFPVTTIPDDVKRFPQK
jgi:hypothetical protein